MAPSSRSPCAACQFLRRKCTQECVFAPHFPREDPHKFKTVHNVYGASNVAKLLNDLPAEDREVAVSTLVYEASARLEYPIYGSVGYVSILQEQLRHIKNEILNSRKELSTYIGPAAFSALPHPHNSGGDGGGGGVGGGTPFGIPTTLDARPRTQMHLPQNQQQALHNQQIAAAISNYEQQVISNSRFSMDGSGGGGGGGGGAGSSVMTVVDGRYNPMSMMGGMPSSSNNPFGAQPAESDHQNPQVSLAAAGASSVHHHQLSLQQQQQLYLQQQQGQVSPGAAVASSVDHHHLSLQQQQQLYLQQQQGQVSPASAGASSVHHHHLSLQQQQQLYLQQQQGQVWPSSAGASSVHHHHLSLQQQQQGQVWPVHDHHLSLQQQQQGQVSPVHDHHLSLQQQQQLHLEQQEGQEPALHLRDAGDDKHSAGPSC